MIYPKIAQLLDKAISEFDQINAERQELLQTIANDINAAKHIKEGVSLVFICTHNSRRSQFGQVWAKIASHYYNLDIETFSGGTEETRFNKNAIDALVDAGLDVTEIKGGPNPIFQLKFSDNTLPITCYSKEFDHKDNPGNNFFALMTCNEADDACPTISGAAKRYALNYKDPKVADGKANQKEVYTERSVQIATEMMFLFSELKKLS